MICLCLTACQIEYDDVDNIIDSASSIYEDFSEDVIHEIPSIFETDLLHHEAYTNRPWIEINNNQPYFDNLDLDFNNISSFENYSNLDYLDRPGVAFACLSTSTMPAENEERGNIGMIKPAGWHTVKYNDLIDGNYLYNRCHLIGWQLCAENANPQNLITGTRYLNIDGMLDFENQIADYLKANPENHVLYRVTPIYEGKNLISEGLLLEAQSCEDDQLVFCVFCYNVQPGIVIDYRTGESKEA